MGDVIQFPLVTGLDRPDWDEWCQAGHRYADYLLTYHDPELQGVDIFEAWQYQAHGPLAFDDVIVLAMSAGIRRRLDEQEDAV